MSIGAVSACCDPIAILNGCTGSAGSILMYAAETVLIRYCVTYTYMYFRVHNAENQTIVSFYGMKL